jgi:hypothetical protein
MSEGRSQRSVASSAQHQ